MINLGIILKPIIMSIWNIKHWTSKERFKNYMYKQNYYQQSG